MFQIKYSTHHSINISNMNHYLSNQIHVSCTYLYVPWGKFYIPVCTLREVYIHLSNMLITWHFQKRGCAKPVNRNNDLQWEVTVMEPKQLPSLLYMTYWCVLIDTLGAFLFFIVLHDFFLFLFKTLFRIVWLLTHILLSLVYDIIVM